MSSTCVRSLIECDCDCHHPEFGQSVAHLTPCCTTCPACNRKIIAGAFDAHVKVCDGTSPPLLPEDFAMLGIQRAS